MSKDNRWSGRTPRDLRTKVSADIPAAVNITFYLAILYIGLAVFSTASAILYLYIDGSVQLDLPVNEFWPALHPTVQVIDGPTAHYLSGGFHTAQVTLSGVGLAAKAWLAIGHLLQGATGVALASAVVVLCSRLRKGSAFSPVLPKAVNFAAAAVALGGFAWQVCLGIGGWIASVELLSVTAWSVDDRSVVGDNLGDLGWPLPGNGFTIDFWPFAMALTLVVVSTAFRYGEKLQRDKRLLLADNARLQRDTEGLV